MNWRLVNEECFTYFSQILQLRSTILIPNPNIFDIYVVVYCNCLYRVNFVEPTTTGVNDHVLAGQVYSLFCVNSELSGDHLM